MILASNYPQQQDEQVKIYFANLFFRTRFKFYIIFYITELFQKSFPHVTKIFKLFQNFLNTRYLSNLQNTFSRRPPKRALTLLSIYV